MPFILGHCGYSLGWTEYFRLPRRFIFSRHPSLLVFRRSFQTLPFCGFFASSVFRCSASPLFSPMGREEQAEGYVPVEQQVSLALNHPPFRDIGFRSPCEELSADVSYSGCETSHASQVVIEFVDLFQGFVYPDICATDTGLTHCGRASLRWLSPGMTLRFARCFFAFTVPVNETFRRIYERFAYRCPFTLPRLVFYWCRIFGLDPSPCSP